MTTLIDALSARTNFGKLMERAEKKNTRYLVSRRGRPKVVVLSVEDYLRNIIKQPEILTSVQITAARSGINALTDEEIETEIGAYRKKRRRATVGNKRKKKR